MATTSTHDPALAPDAEDEQVSIWSSIAFIGISLIVIAAVVWYFWFRRGAHAIVAPVVTPVGIARGLRQGVDGMVDGAQIKASLLQ